MDDDWPVVNQRRRPNPTVAPCDIKLRFWFFAAMSRFFGKLVWYGMNRVNVFAIHRCINEGYGLIRIFTEKIRISPTKLWRVCWGGAMLYQDMKEKGVHRKKHKIGERGDWKLDAPTSNRERPKKMSRSTHLSQKTGLWQKLMIKGSNQRNCRSIVGCYESVGPNTEQTKPSSQSITPPDSF